MSFPTRLIRWSFYALVFLIPLIFLPHTSELFEFNKMIVTYLITVVIAAAWFSDCILQKRFIFRHTILDLPILIFVICEFVSLVFSINPHTSWFGYYSRFNGGLASLLCYSLLYWAYVTYMDKKSTLFLIHTSLFSATAVALWGIAEHFGVDASRWVQDVQNRVFSTLGQPNWLAAYLVALIFIPISYLTPFRSPSPKLGEGLGVRYWVNLGILVLLFLTLLFTRSRSGLLAFAISSAVFWIIYLLRTRNLKIPLILNSLFIILIFVTNNPISERFYRKTTPISAGKSAGPALESEVNITESGNIRKIVWSGAIRIWLDSPKNFLLGSGPETFAMSYYQHRPIEHNATSEWELLYNKAHNEFLNYLANTGLLGLLSYMILLVFMAITFFKSQASNPKPQSNLNISNPKSQNWTLDNWSLNHSLGFGIWSLRLALFSGWLSLSITNFWGFSVVITNIFLFLFPAIAISLSESTIQQANKPTSISKSQIFLLSIPLFFILYSLFLITRYWLADVRYASGQYNLKVFTTTQEPSHLLNSYRSFVDAYRLNSNEPAISAEFSTVAAFVAASLPADLPAEAGTQAEAGRLTQLAISLSDKSISENPFHPNYFKFRSRAFLILATINPKYYVPADEALAQAAKISPTDPRIPYNRGLIAQYQNDSKKAAEFFAAANALRPGLAPTASPSAKIEK